MPVILKKKRTFSDSVWFPTCQLQLGCHQQQDNNSIDITAGHGKLRRFCTVLFKTYGDWTTPTKHWITPTPCT